MFDLQTVLNNAVQAQRDEEMKTSVQLALVELTMLLKGVTNPNLPVFFEGTNRRATGVDSWRGRYAELAIGYTEENETNGLDVKNLLRELEEAIGKTFEGYKGGSYVMGKSTPVWVANYGSSACWILNQKEGWHESLFVVGVQEMEDKVLILTRIDPS